MASFFRLARFAALVALLASGVPTVLKAADPVDPDGPYWEIDPTFAPVLEGNASAGLSVSTWAYPGGRLLVSTSGHIINGAYTSGLVRMTGEGLVDPGFLISDPNLRDLLAVYPDGRLLCIVRVDDHSTASAIKRLLADGTDDPTFPSLEVDTDNVKALLLSDGDILLYGAFSTIGGTSHAKMCRLNTDGSIDPEFQSPIPMSDSSLVVSQVMLDNAGELFVSGILGLGSGRHRLARLHSNGTVDAGFISGDVVPRTILSSAEDGKIVLVDNTYRLIRLDRTGAIDGGFARELSGSLPDFGARNPDGTFFYTTYALGGSAFVELHRLTADFMEDATFTPVRSNYAGPHVSIPTVTDDGRIYVEAFTEERKAKRLELVRLGSTGAIDPDFNPRFSRPIAPSATIRQLDGKMLVAGRFDFVNGQAQTGYSALVRLMEDGSLDSGFSASLPENSSIDKLVVAADGKIIAFGLFPLGDGTYAKVQQFDPSGAREEGFATITSLLQSATADAEGRIYALLYGPLVRFLPNGQVDPTFVPSPLSDGIRAILPLANGNTLIAQATTGGDVKLVRLRSDGSQDDNLKYADVPGFLGWVGMPDATALILSRETVAIGAEARYQIRVQWLSATENRLNSDLSFRSPLFSNTVPGTDVRLTIAGLLNDQLRAAAGSAPAGMHLDPAYVLGIGLDGGTDQKLYLTDSGTVSGEGRISRYVRSTESGPSFSTALQAYTPSLNPTVVPQGYSVFIVETPGGIGPFSYQWLKAGVPIAGATERILYFPKPGVTLADAGEYSVIVSNPFGTSTSPAVTLDIDPVAMIASITTPPDNQTVMSGNSVTFTVTAVGNPAPTYQWFFNDYALPGETGSSLTLAHVQPSKAGAYRVRVENLIILGIGTYLLSDEATATLTVQAHPAAFAWAGYLASNPDVAAVIGSDPASAWSHYINYGIFEGRTDGDFSVQAYLAQYPELAAQFGTDLRAAALHWYTTGRQNGDRIPKGFDVLGYLARNADIAALFTNDKYGAWLHYYNYGLYEGRSFDANFIPAEYLELNIDLKAVFGSNLQAAVMHWFNYGHPIEDRMGRVPIGFNVDSYLARYPDLAAVFSGIAPTAVRNVTVWHHYLAYGTLEGRSDGEFEAYHYLATNPDLAGIFGSDIQAAALHWYFYGRREGRRIPGGFTVQNYRALYPDVVLVFGDDLYGSWLHYRDNGVFEGRVYDNLFRPADYLNLNPDVAAAIGTNYRDALLHWLYYGQYEGRAGRL